MSKINSKDYVVLDVETNGLSSLKHDLLSISIYKPDDNKTYDRFLPLELNSFVETYWINGIKEDMLSDKTPLTQEEFDKLVNDFELDRRTILTYGSIDEKFIKNYLKRKKIKGFEKLNFYNFKHDIISSKFSEGNITKDNLCNIYEIDGTKDIHSGLNDCILEWKLFEKMNGNKLVIISNAVYEFNDEYMIPASYLQTYPNFKYSIKNYPRINYELIPIKSFDIKSKELKKFDTNISGMTIEHLINTMIEAKDANSETLLFQIQNRDKLKMIGKLPSMIHTISAFFNNNGTITAVNKEDEEMVKRINEVTLAIKKEILPLISYIRSQIFNNEKILSQELVLNENDNVMAKCDLSSNNAILEIKAFNGNDIDKLKYQLYYEANGRDIYLLQTFWSVNIKNGLKFTIYKANPIEYVEKHSDLEVRKNNFEKKINNEHISVVTYNEYGQKVLLRCKKCNNEWESSYRSILRYNQCPFCNPKEKKISEKTSSPVMTREEKFQKKFSNYQYKIAVKSNSTIQVLEYKSSREPVRVKCLTCGLEKIYSRADHFLGRCSCPNCKKIK